MRFSRPVWTTFCAAMGALSAVSVYAQTPDAPTLAPTTPFAREVLMNFDR